MSIIEIIPWWQLALTARKQLNYIVSNQRNVRQPSEKITITNVLSDLKIVMYSNKNYYIWNTNMYMTERKYVKMKFYAIR